MMKQEQFDTIVARAHPFINYQFDPYSRPEFVELFELPKFKAAVNEVCAAYGAPYFRPFQLSNIINLYGQSVPAHLTGASQDRMEERHQSHKIPLARVHL